MLFIYWNPKVPKTLQQVQICPFLPIFFTPKLFDQMTLELERVITETRRSVRLHKILEICNGMSVLEKVAHMLIIKYPRIKC